MTVAVKPAKIKTDEYDRMAASGVFGPDRGRLELLGGQLYEMPPIGTAHLIVVTRLQVELAEINRQGRLLVQQPIRVPDYDEPQPDLTVLRLPLDTRVQAGLGKPEAIDCELVIEVSDTTLDYDHRIKVPAYKQGGVKRIWIVNVRHGVVEAYEGPVFGVSTHYPGEKPLEIDGITIDVEALFANLPLDE